MATPPPELLDLLPAVEEPEDDEAEDEGMEPDELSESSAESLKMRCLMLIPQLSKLEMEEVGDSGGHCWC
jgi:hypothetical protein